MNLYLSPNGRISQSTYWRGVITLFVVSAVLSVVSAFVSPFLGMLGLVVIWPWIVLHVKRLHDGGMTGWITIAVIVAAIVISFILGMVLQPLLGVNQAAIQEEINAVAASGDVGAIMDVTKDLSKKQLPASLLQSALMTGIIGFGMSLIKSDPAPNDYGPPEGPSADTFS